jgi:uncharacterized membrane-anchored protein YhcB (DUF1043 family)
MRLFASLTNRIFVATAALAVMGIAVAVYRINVAVTAQAENELRRGLVEAANLLEEHRTTLFEHFSREAHCRRLTVEGGNDYRRSPDRAADRRRVSAPHRLGSADSHR